jgi:phosphonate transport system ATP-binding protein
MTKSTEVELSGVVCSAERRTLLEIGSLRIMAGERIAILGHNGAGKTTLLRIIGGLMQVQHGNVRVLGRELHGRLSPDALRALRQEVGQVMQGLHLVARLSAVENVLIGCLGRIKGWRSIVRYYPPNEIANAHTALKEVGMLSRANIRADRLSGGERQKVAIARLLMQRPRLILADEPTAALDPAAAADVCQLLAKAAIGATLISVVHTPALLPVLADRVIGLKHGALLFDLPLAEVDDGRLIKLYRPDGKEIPRRLETTAGGQLVTSMEQSR